MAIAGYAAAGVMRRCVFDVSISMHDMEIERRPYHRNCRCALHKLRGVCSNACAQQRNISFPKKQPWNDCCLLLEAWVQTPNMEAYVSF